MKKKLMTLLVATCVASFALVGCGKSDDKKEEKVDKSKERTEKVKDEIVPDSIDDAANVDDDKFEGADIYEDADANDDSANDNDSADVSADKFTAQYLADSMLTDNVTMDVEGQGIGQMTFVLSGGNLKAVMDIEGTYVEVYYVDGDTYSFTSYGGMEMWTKLEGQYGINIENPAGEVNVDTVKEVTLEDTITENGKEYYVLRAVMNDGGQDVVATYYVNTANDLTEKIVTSDSSTGELVIHVEEGGDVVLPAGAANAIPIG